MADVDDTANAPPEPDSGAVPRHILVTFPAESALDDVIRASFAIGQVLAQGVAACDGKQRHPAMASWWEDARTVHGLTAALQILDERADALRRHGEGPGA
jgi:hypothetical protein